MSARRSSRQAALQVLYALDLGASGSDTPARARAAAAFDTVTEHFELPEGARAFAKELVGGVAEHLGEIDGILAAHATHWRVERMAIVDRNVLRLAVWEMRWGRTPASVAIDEAVELARRFGGERSTGFVNGVLDAVARTLEADSGAGPVQEPRP